MRLGERWQGLESEEQLIDLVHADHELEVAASLPEGRDVNRSRINKHFPDHSSEPKTTIAPLNLHNELNFFRCQLFELFELLRCSMAERRLFLGPWGLQFRDTKNIDSDIAHLLTDELFPREEHTTVLGQRNQKVLLVFETWEGLNPDLDRLLIIHKRNALPEDALLLDCLGLNRASCIECVPEEDPELGGLEPLLDSACGVVLGYFIFVRNCFLDDLSGSATLDHSGETIVRLFHFFPLASEDQLCCVKELSPPEHGLNHPESLHLDGVLLE